MTDLKGKIIGVEDTSLGGFFLSRALEISKTDSRDVTVKHIRVDEQYDAFVNKKVDAIVTHEPVASEARKIGGNVIFSSIQIPGEIVDVLIVQSNLIDSHLKELKKIEDGWYKALQYMKDNPQDAYTIMGKRLRSDVNTTKEMFKGLVIPSKYEAGKMMAEGTLNNGIQKISAFLNKKGKLKKKDIIQQDIIYLPENK